MFFEDLVFVWCHTKCFLTFLYKVYFKFCLSSLVKLAKFVSGSGPNCLMSICIIQYTVGNSFKNVCRLLRLNCKKQSCGSGMIYSGSGSGSSSEFSEFWFRIRIQAKVADPCGSGSNQCYLSIFVNCKQNHLKFNHKEELSTICHFLFHTVL